MKEMLSHFDRLDSMAQLRGKKLEKAMAHAHRKTATSLVAGRNIVAGYARGFTLQFGTMLSVLQEDPLYQEALGLIEELKYYHSHSLMNVFLILKYGMKYLKGDIIDTERSGFCSLFIAYVTRAFGFRGTVYSLDNSKEPARIVHPDHDEKVTQSDGEKQNGNLTQHPSGFPASAGGQDKISELERLHLEKRQKMLGLTNLVFIKGSFLNEAPRVLKQAKPIILAHLDGGSYAPLKESLSILKSAMHPLGGYFIFNESLNPKSLIAFQAAEEFVEEEKVHAEQIFPHLVYRFPHLKPPHTISPKITRL